MKVRKILHRVLSRLVHLDSSEFRKHLKKQLLNALKGKMVVITHYGAQIAALVSVKDAARLKVLQSPRYKQLLKQIDAELE